MSCVVSYPCLSVSMLLRSQPKVSMHPLTKNLLFIMCTYQLYLQKKLGSSSARRCSNLKGALSPWVGWVIKWHTYYQKKVTYLWDAKGCHNSSCAYRWSFLNQWQGSLWVTQIEYDSLTSKLESNPHLMSTTKILSLRYLDLPLYLKSSFKVVSYLSWLYGWSFLLASCTNIFFQECGLNSMTNLLRWCHTCLH